MVNTSKLKGLIAENGLSVSELARKKNVSAWALSKQIRNMSSMSVDTMMFLADELRIHPSDFRKYFFVDEVAKCN